MISQESGGGRAIVLFDRAVRWLALTAGIVLVGIVLLTVADVVLRKGFNSPIFGRQNISELALLVVIFLAMAYCGRNKGHVSVDLIGGMVPRRWLRYTDGLVDTIGAGVFLLLGWRAIEAAGQAAEMGRTSNLLAIPHWPFYLVIALGAVLYAVVQILDTIRGRGD